MSWVEVAGAGWSWVHGLVIPVLRNFATFAGNHLCQSLFFNKVAGQLAVTKPTIYFHFGYYFFIYSQQQSLQKNIWRKKNIAFPNANPMMMTMMMMMMLIIIITIIIIIIIIISSSSSSSRSSSISFSLAYISAGCGSIK